MYSDITAFAPLENGELFVELASGEQGVFDMRPYMSSEFFAELTNPTYFDQAFIEYGVITWPHGQDISPATIRLEMRLQQCPNDIALRHATMNVLA